MMLSKILNWLLRKKTFCRNSNCLYLKRGKCTLKTVYIGEDNRCVSYDFE